MKSGPECPVFDLPFLPSSSDHFQNVTSLILIFIALRGSKEDFSLSLRNLLQGKRLEVESETRLEREREPRGPGPGAALLEWGQEGRGEEVGHWGFWICVYHVLRCLDCGR